MPRAFTILIVLVAALLNCGLVSAQANEKPCPTVSIACPTDEWKDGDLVRVSAQVQGDIADANLNYRWSVSAGTIKSGQGTPSITLDTSNTAGQIPTATVEVEGIAGCPMTRSCSLLIIDGPPPEPRLFDQYSLFSLREEKQRLDNFAARLQQEPDTAGYLVVFAGRESRVSEALSHIRSAAKYLITQRGINAKRIIMANGGTRAVLTFELYMLPPNVMPSLYLVITPNKGRTRKSRRTSKGQHHSH